MIESKNTCFVDLELSRVSCSEIDIPTTFTLHVDDVLPAEFESSHIHDPVSDNLDSLTDKRQTTAVGPRSFMAELGLHW